MTPELVDRAHAAGSGRQRLDGQRPTTCAAMVDLGVDAVITDGLSRALAVVGERRRGLSGQLATAGRRRHGRRRARREAENGLSPGRMA